MKLVITFILFTCVTVIKGDYFITLDGHCPFNYLKPSPLATVPLLKGKYNLIARSEKVKDNRTDIVALFQQSDRGQVKITERYPLENGYCQQDPFVLNATKTPGVFDNEYKTDSGSFAPNKLVFLSFKPNLSSVVFSCHDLPDNKYQFEIIVFSAITKKFGQMEKDMVKKLLDSNGIGFLYKYITESKHSIGKSPCDFSPKEVLQSSYPVKV